MFELVKTRPGKQISYESPAAEKKPRKKLKSDSSETKEEVPREIKVLESNSSQLSQQSTSSPATQTPSASPTLKGFIFAFMMIIASFRFEDDDENEDEVQLLLIVRMLKSVTVMA